MKTRDKYLNEAKYGFANDAVQRAVGGKKRYMVDVFKEMDVTTFGGLKDAYYSIADNTTNFLTYLELAAKKNPELKSELAIAKKAVDLFKKLSIGRYL